eukprot:2413859-Rhodomonas_salina.1
MRADARGGGGSSTTGCWRPRPRQGPGTGPATRSWAAALSWTSSASRTAPRSAPLPLLTFVLFFVFDAFVAVGWGWDGAEAEGPAGGCRW